MSTHNAGGSGSEPGSQSVGAGPGNDSGQPSQRDSGGSGGAQLTRSLEDVNGAAPSIPVEPLDALDEGALKSAGAVAPEGAGSAPTATTRGAQDTHASQAGSTGTGLGAPETGAAQQMRDLPPPRK